MISRSLLLKILAGLVLFCIIAGLYWLTVRGVVNPSNTVSDEYNLVLQDLEGNAVSLSAYRKRPLVAIMWASWCVYCEDELRNLTRLKEEFRDQVSIVAINRAEPPPEAKAYIDSLTGVHDIVFLLDPDDLFFKSIDGYSMPETLFIHTFGNIFYHHRGPLPYEEAEKQLKAMLSGSL